MKNWFMLTLIGQDQSGIVARISELLYQGRCHLGEASMLRLGGNFTIMLMVNSDSERADIEALLKPAAQALKLHMHLDSIEGYLHQHQAADVRVSVHGADRSGIVAQVTQTLAAAGLNIVDLTSDVAGSSAEPIYIMQIEGVATLGIEALQTALQALQNSQGEALQVHLAPLDTLIM